MPRGTLRPERRPPGLARPPPMTALGSAVPGGVEKRTYAESLRPTLQFHIPPELLTASPPIVLRT